MRKYCFHIFFLNSNLIEYMLIGYANVFHSKKVSQVLLSGFEFSKIIAVNLETNRCAIDHALKKPSFKCQCKIGKRPPSTTSKLKF